MFSRCLLGGLVLEVFKDARIFTPLLKKSDIDPADVRSYRPISNMTIGCVQVAGDACIARQLLGYFKSPACFHGSLLTVLAICQRPSLEQDVHKDRRV